MRNYAAKFRLIFNPYFIISVGSLTVYSFLRWLFFIKTNSFTIDEEFLDFWVPWVFSWIPILIWLRPRLKLLNLKNKNGKGDPLTVFMLVASLGIAAPIMVAQAYLETATGKLTQLEQISQIDAVPQTKFYTIRNYYVDKKLARFTTKFKVSGKYNSDFDMYIFGVVPVYDANHTSKTYNYQIGAKGNPINSNNALIVLNGIIINKAALSRLNPRTIKHISVLKGPPAVALYGEQARNGVILVQTGDKPASDTLQVIHDDNAQYEPYAWIAIRYERTISNHLSNDQKETRYKLFANECQADFESKSIDRFVYLDRVPFSADLKGYKGALNDARYPAVVDSKNIFLPVFESIESRNGSKLPWIFGSLGIGSVVFLLILLIKPLKDDTLTPETVEPVEEAAASISGTFASLINIQKVFRVTLTLIELNLFIFLVMVFSGLGFMSFEAPDLLKWGANYRPLVVEGQYWRLLTNTFLHAGLMHVLFNMYGLFFAGMFLEPVLGRARLLVTYLICGITASIASAWWHPATISIGASGAIFGLFGVLFALASVNALGGKLRKPMLVNVAIFVGYNLVLGLGGGIDNAAHIGGLITGLVLGYLLAVFVKKAEAQANDKTQQIIDELTGQKKEDS